MTANRSRIDFWQAFLIIFTLLAGIFILPETLPFLFGVNFYLMAQQIRREHLSLFSNSFYWLFILLIALAMTNLRSSIYFNNSVEFIQKLFYLLLYINLIRLVSLSDDAKRMIAYIVTILGVLLALFTIAVLAIFYMMIWMQGFVRVLDFRFMINPFGIPLNEWTTQFILFFPFSAIAIYRCREDKSFRFCFFCGGILLILPMVLSFSRGIYLALGFMMIAISLFVIKFKLIPWKKVALTALVFSVISIAAILPARLSFVSTLHGNKTISQQRSREGRIKLWKKALTIPGERLLTGVGAYNFSMRYVSEKDRTEDTAFTSQSANLFVLVFVEHGVAGLLIFIALFALGIMGFISRLKRPKVEKIELIFFSCSIAALILREMTFSSLMNNNLMILLCGLIIGLLSYPIQGYLQIKKLDYLILILLSLAFGFIYWHTFKIEKAKKHHCDCIASYHAGQWAEAQKSLRKAIEWNPQQALYYSDMALMSYQLLDTCPYFDKSALFIDRGDMDCYRYLDIIQFYQSALQFNPADDGYHFNLGWIYWLMGDDEQALIHFNEAIRIEPNFAIYHIGLGLLHEKLKHPISAVSEYLNAIRLSPDILDSPFYQGLSASYRISIENSIGNLIAELEQKGDSPIYHGRLAKLYLYQGRLNEAESLLVRLTTQVPNLSRPWLWLGIVHRQRRQFGAMIRCCQKSAFVNSHDYLPCWVMGQYYASVDDEQDADYCFLQVRKKIKEQYSEHYFRAQYIYRMAGIKKDWIPNGLYEYISPMMADVTQKYPDEMKDNSLGEMIQ